MVFANVGNALTLTLMEFSRSSFEPLLSAAKVSFAASNLSMAQQHLDKACAGGGSLRASVGLAQVHLLLENPAEAQTHAHNAATLDPNNFQSQVVVYGTKILNNASESEISEIELLHSLISVADTADRCLSLLRLFSPKPICGLAAFEKFKSRFSQYPRCLVECAKFHYTLEQLQPGLDLLRLAKKMSHGSFEIHNMLGVILKRI